jgi:hypothetical protein
MIDQIGGRKFIFAILCVISGTVLLVAGRITPEVWINFVQFMGVTYVAGNVGSKLVNK